MEACDCDVLCPCWVGEDPDNGTCDSALIYDIESGQIAGVDVSALSVVVIVHVPSNVFARETRQLIYLSDTATPEQFAVLAAAFTGKLGGPLQDLSELVGERVGVYPAPIDYSLVEGQGQVEIPGMMFADVAPFRSKYGTTTTLHDSIFSTIPGSPAWVGKASVFEMNIPEHGFVWRFTDSNAIQGEFRFEH